MGRDVRPPSPSSLPAPPPPGLAARRRALPPSPPDPDSPPPSRSQDRAHVARPPARHRARLGPPDRVPPQPRGQGFGRAVRPGPVQALEAEPERRLRGRPRLVALLCPHRRRWDEPRLHRHGLPRAQRGVRLQCCFAGSVAPSAIIFPSRAGTDDRSPPRADWSKRQNPPALVPPSSSSSSSSSSAPAQPARDFSLKEGETISIKLGGLSTKKKAPAPGGAGGGGGGGLGGFMLPPPPPAPPRGR